MIIVLRGFLNNHEQCNLVNIQKTKVELWFVRACRAPRRGCPPSSYVSKAPPPLYHILFLRDLLCITLSVEVRVFFDRSFDRGMKDESSVESMRTTDCTYFTLETRNEMAMT